MEPYRVTNPFIAERTMRQILHVADIADDNPLNLGKTDILTQAAEDRMEAILTGADVTTMKRLANSLGVACATEDHSRGVPTETGDLDEVSTLLMRHMGLSPLVVAWMARTGEGVEVMQGNDMLAEIDIWSDPTHEQCTTRVFLAPTVSWLAIGALAVDLMDMPETVIGALEGRPLRDAFSHPALDALGMTITGVEHRRVDDERCTVLSVDRPRRMMTPADLLRIGIKEA